jgi:hypothetical protein
MLFAPVPSTQLFEKYRDYYKQRGWCDETGMVRDLHLLNGKLFPFLQMNDGSVEDYIDLQRMMFMLNQNYRSKSFSVFGEGTVSKSFRQVIGNFKTAEAEQTLINGQRMEAITRIASDLEFAKGANRSIATSPALSE